MHNALSIATARPCLEVNRMPTPRRVAIRALGGTIAMARVRPGQAAVPAIDAAGLIAAVPGLSQVAQVDSASVRSIPSASLEVSDIFQLLDDMVRSCEAGADGVVVTMGTDTLEEVAYALDLLWPRPEPVVVTGAMRTADALSADGPANLLAAVTVAATTSATERGVLVVMNDMVHAAREVRKAHSTSTAAFASPTVGPVGFLQEGRAHFHAVGPRRRPVPTARDTPVPRVAILRVTLGADTRLLTCAARDYDGIVVETLGAGHVPEWWMPELKAAAAHIPVVMTTRTGGGAVLRSTYSFPGSESDLIAAGVVPAGDLDGIKARMLLTLCLMVGSDTGAVLGEFSRHVRPRPAGCEQ